MFNHQVLLGSHIPILGGTEPTNPKSLIHVCGFECRPTGNLGGTTGEHIWSGGSPVTIVNAGMRTGSRCLRFNGTGLSANEINVLAAGNIRVVRFYIKFTTRPNISSFLHWCGANNASRVGLFYNASDQKLYAAVGADPVAAGATGISVATGQWYRIDMKIDQTPGAKTCDLQVDGVAAGQAANSDGTAASKLNFGATNVIASPTGDWLIDDFCVSETAADYPIGPGHVDKYSPSADGTHVISGANVWEYTGGTDITNATVDAYTHLDEPFTFSSFIADYIMPTSLATMNDWVETKFGPANGASPAVKGPRGVLFSGVMQLLFGNNSNGKIRLFDFDTVDEIRDYPFGFYPQGVYLFNKCYSNPPSAAGLWNVDAGLAGDFNNVRIRTSGTDADSTFGAYLAEAEFEDV